MSAKRHRFHGIGQLESHARAERMRPILSDRQRQAVMDAQVRGNGLGYILAGFNLKTVRWSTIAPHVRHVAGARPC